MYTANEATPRASAPVRELAVPSEIGNMRHSVDALEGACKAMLDRLCRVLRQPDARPPAMATDHPPRPVPRCSFEEDLLGLRDRIDTIRGTIEAMLEHLEI